MASRVTGQGQGRVWLCVLAVLIYAFLALPTAAAGQAVPLTGSICGSVSEAQTDLCVALETRSCGLTADSEAFWFCKGVLERQCGVIEGANYSFCEALRTRECGVIAGTTGYRLCEGILQRNCGLAPDPLRWMCVVLEDAFREG
jgi:hypothetical protein